MVRDVAERFQGKEAASEAAWIQAIYAELGGEGFTSAQDCLAKLQAQRLVDANDWALIMADCRLARNHGVQALALHERHNVPAVHGPDEAPRWAHTLITHRIGELYSTVPGFAGHAQQVQQAISQFVGWFEERRFDEATYRKLKGEIVGALRSGKARAKGIPDWVYTFEGGSTETI